jgi:hypothetical protein
MYVYLECDPAKGIPENHHIACNPGGHLGLDKVPSSWTELNDHGERVGRTFHIHFINGRADTEFDGVGQYLLDHGMALKEPWRPPPNAPFAAADPGARWREP